MNQIDKDTIKTESHKYIKYMCYDILISTDNQVFNLSFKSLKEQLRGWFILLFYKWKI